MWKRNVAMGLAVSALALLPAISNADTPSQSSGAQCTLTQYTIAAVQPYRVDLRISQTPITEVRGAELYIPAQPGLTAEWLQLSLQRDLAKVSNGSGENACSFSSKVRVEAISGGAGFWVRLIAADSKEGAKVLERTRQLFASQAADRKRF
jgi:hypothetical protein